jgi:RNA exonuclease 1
VTVIDASKNVLLDELVMPDNPILDYNTKYSGITEEMLKEVEPLKPQTSTAHTLKVL